MDSRQTLYYGQEGLGKGVAILLCFDARNESHQS
jgi:hypothetical protein